jgi:hypothetical protein
MDGRAARHGRTLSPQIDPIPLLVAAQNSAPRRLNRGGAVLRLMEGVSNPEKATEQLHAI